MVIELESPRETKTTVTSRWTDVAGQQLEVFSYGGIEYVKGEPAAIVITLTKLRGAKLGLVPRESKPSASALCTLHKTYRAIRKPRTNCEQCWGEYNARHS